MEVDILEFRVPVESNKTVFVWDIPPVLTQDQVYDQLFHVFSPFGPIYLLKVCPNAPLHPPGFYGVIKFYSADHAAKAQKHTDGRPLLRTSALKVKLSARQTPQFLSGRHTPLSHARCLDLANRCLGFNGWTSDIITLKELSCDEGEDEDEGRRRMKFGCMMKLNFPQHGVTTKGIALVEETFTCTGPEVLLQRHCKLQRSVRERALVQAFSSVLLILLGNGKVMVELKQTSDQVEADETEDVLQVNEFSLPGSPADEEEDEDWDLSVS